MNAVHEEGIRTRGSIRGESKRVRDVARETSDSVRDATEASREVVDDVRFEVQLFSKNKKISIHLTWHENRDTRVVILPVTLPAALRN